MQLETSLQQVEPGDLRHLVEPGVREVPELLLVLLMERALFYCVAVVRVMLVVY